MKQFSTCWTFRFFYSFLPLCSAVVAAPWFLRMKCGTGVLLSLASTLLTRYMMAEEEGRNPRWGRQRGVWLSRRLPLAHHWSLPSTASDKDASLLQCCDSSPQLSVTLPLLPFQTTWHKSRVYTVCLMVVPCVFSRFSELKHSSSAVQQVGIHNIELSLSRKSLY